MSLKESIQKTLNAREENSRKLVTVNLDAKTLDRVDKIAKAFSKVNTARNFSRNSIIEEAVQVYADESERILLDEYNININDDLTEENVVTYFDLAIFPAHNDGFTQVFLGEKKWYSVRIKEDKIPQIKFVALYRSAPVSAVTHYAKVKQIKQYQDTDKKIIIFDGAPVELPQAVKLGGTNANAMRAPRYTTLAKLLQASEINELF